MAVETVRDSALITHRRRLLIRGLPAATWSAPAACDFTLLRVLSNHRRGEVAGSGVPRKGDGLIAASRLADPRPSSSTPRSRGALILGFCTSET